MGFFDKIKDALKRIKEDNKYFARTTARINSNRLYGWVNYKTCKIDPNDDLEQAVMLILRMEKVSFTIPVMRITVSLE